jgi:hypothetical protein
MKEAKTNCIDTQQLLGFRHISGSNQDLDKTLNKIGGDEMPTITAPTDDSTLIDRAFNNIGEVPQS